MRPMAMRIGETSLERAVGCVLAHDVPVPDSKGFLFRKGHQLRSEDLKRLAELQGFELHVLEIEQGDLHEQPAGERLARAVAGPGVRIRGFNGSQFDLVAEHRGVLHVDAPLLQQVNHLEGVSIFSLFDGQPLDDGQPVAGVKVTPLLIAERVIREAERLCQGCSPLRVQPFLPMAVGAVVPLRIDEATRSRFKAALERKLAWYGASLAMLLEVENTEPAFADAFRQLQQAGIDVIMTAGAKSLDPLEPIFLSLRDVGAAIIKHGVPVDPGSLFWLAYLPNGDRQLPVFGLSSCEMFSHKTVLELILPRVFSGEHVDRSMLVKLGHGGMLTRDMAFRFPPYP